MYRKRGLQQRRAEEMQQSELVNTSNAIKQPVWNEGIVSPGQYYIVETTPEHSPLMQKPQQGPYEIGDHDTWPKVAELGSPPRARP